METLRIFLVDNNAWFLRTLTRILAGLPDIEIVGKALSGFEALMRIPVAHPDIVLMDISMPGMNGIETTRRLKAADPHRPVLMLTMHDEAAYRQAAAQAGADDYVMKSECGTRLVHLLERYVSALTTSDRMRPDTTGAAPTEFPGPSA